MLRPIVRVDPPGTTPRGEAGCRRAGPSPGGTRRTASLFYAEWPGRRVGSAKKGSDYFMLSGTSMAAAVTSGVVALILEAHEERFKERLAPNAVKALLEFSAIPLPGVDRLTQGAGEVNAAGAIQLAASVDPASPSGSWWLTAGVDTYTTIDGTSLSGARP